MAVRLALRNRLLAHLHRWNGWNVVFLLISGLVLYFPQLRGLTAPVRVPLKTAHIISGLVMIVMLLAYAALLPDHWRRLTSRLGQQLNVVLLVAVTVVWSVTGLVLWQYRSLPPAWAATALVWHDAVTWFLLPWLAAHSLTRYFRVKLTLPDWWRRSRRTPAGAETALERRAVLGNLVWGLMGGAWAIYGWKVLSPLAGSAAAADGSPGSPDSPGALPEDGLTVFDPTHPDMRSAAAAGGVPMPVPSAPPEGGGRQGQFRIYTVTDDIPAFRPDTWRFTVSGPVQHPVDLDWPGFLQLPRQRQVSDFHCVTGWSVFRITWEGVRLRDLLDLVGVRPPADHVKFYSDDGVYTDDLPLDVARGDDILLAYLMDGKPLPLANGGPVRLVIPQMYAYKSVKWLNGVELITGPHTGYWEGFGYPRNAWIARR